MRADLFLTHVLDLMRPWAGVTARAMFGGYGIKREGIHFALVADGALYLKVDAQTEALFVTARSAPFVYAAKGRQVTLSYWRAPEACLESPLTMGQWCDRAWEVALRASARTSKRR